MNKSNNRNLGLFFLWVILFLLISFLSKTTIGEGLDALGNRWATANHSQTSLSFMTDISESGILVIGLFTVLLTVLFIIKRQWWDFIFYYFTLIGGLAFNFILKLIFHRPRPAGAEHFYHLSSFKIESYSYPSGHVMRVTVLVLLLIYFLYHYIKNKVWRNIAIILAVVYLILLSLSRIFLHAHFITDVLGALLASLTWLFLCLFLYRLIHRKQQQQ